MEGGGAPFAPADPTPDSAAPAFGEPGPGGERPPDIIIAGAGLAVPGDLTVAAEAAVRGARVVFYSRYHESLAPRLRRLSPEAELRVQEAGEYVFGMYRPAMYRRMAEAVIAAAETGGRVVVLQPGSAVVVDAVTRAIRAAAEPAGLTVSVLPGVSSIEGVLVEMGWDAAGGLQVVLAQSLVLHGLRLNPALAALILQPGYYDTRWYVGAARAVPGRFDALQAALERTWSREAEMALVLLPFDAERRTGVLWFRLESLHAAARLLCPSHTLFVPPTVSSPVDPAFEARIESWEDVLGRLARNADGTVAEQSAGECFAPPADSRAPELLAESARIAARWRARRRAANTR